MKGYEKFALILGAVIVVGSAAPIFADYTVDTFEPVVVSDDIYNTTKEVVSLAGPAGSDTSGKSNNGNGNNEDGVDSSNPGQGGGGPNGAEDASCTGDGTCVDDESKGGKKK